MSEVKIFSETTLSDKKYPLKEIGFEKPGHGGKPVKQLHEIYYRPDNVTVLLVDYQEQTILLTNQFRVASFINGNPSGDLIEACAGLIDEGESPEQAAQREAMEETGYHISNLKKVGAVYPSAGGVTEFLHLFIAEYDSKGEHEKGGGLEEEGEYIEMVELTFEEAKSRMLGGQFNDAKTLLLVQSFFLNRQVYGSLDTDFNLT
jgi:nudix-type nucleoside diphosphatase (YffH/AdpP family)